MLPALPSPSPDVTASAVAGPPEALPLLGAVAAGRGRSSRRRGSDLGLGRAVLPAWLRPCRCVITPGPTALAARSGPSTPWTGWLASLLVLLLLVSPLSGCSASAQPPQRVLLDALALQIRLTQDQVAQALQLPPTGLPEVSRVRVEQQQPVDIGDAHGLRLTGRFDWRLAADPIRVDSPFELYLQRGERGQSWRLARPLGEPADGVQAWITEPLPLPGERLSRPPSVSASGSDGAG